MELLNDELDGFNRSLDKLEKLTMNVDNIKIRSDTSQIEYLLKEHLDSAKTNNSKLQESVTNITEQISKARLIPKSQLWLHYSIWITSLIIIGYLAFKVSQLDDTKEKAFTEGEQEVILNLKGYFDQNPEHYQSYLKWIKKEDRVPNQE